MTFLVGEAVGHIAGAAFTAVQSVPITQKGLPPAFERSQADADLTAGAHLIVLA
jgi:hypothetical protein